MNKRKNNNKKMMIFTIVVFMTMLVFLTSKLWLPDDRRMMNVDKVVLQNRVFTKQYERIDDELIEIKLTAPKQIGMYEQIPFLEHYNNIVVTINNKKNTALYIALYNELLEHDELLIQIPYIDYVDEKAPFYYAEIKFESNASILSDYRQVERVDRIKPKNSAYSACLQTQMQYDITKKENEALDVKNGQDETQQEAIKKADVEQKEMLKTLEKELAVCSINYID